MWEKIWDVISGFLGDALSSYLGELAFFFSVYIIVFATVIYVLLKGRKSKLFPRKTKEHIVLYILTILQLIFASFLYIDIPIEGFDIGDYYYLGPGAIYLLLFAMLAVYLYIIIGIFQFFSPGNKKANILKVLYYLIILYWTFWDSGDLLFIIVSIAQFVFLQKVLRKEVEVTSK